jgi:hypothetical protein
MHPSTALRAGAVLTASALALSLGTATATAAESAPGKSPLDTASKVHTPDGAARWTTTRSAARRATGTATVTSIKVADGYLFTKGANSIDVTINGDPGTSAEGAEAKSVAITVRIDGKTHVDVPVSHWDGGDEDPETGTDYFDTHSSWGAGKAQILQTTVTYTDGDTSVLDTRSNVFYLRSVVRSGNPAVYYTNYSHTKIKFQARGWKVFKPSTGKYVSLGSVRLQYRKSGSWKTLKKIKLNSSGNGSYTYKAPTRTYRLYVPKTSTVAGGSTASFRS